MQIPLLSDQWLDGVVLAFACKEADLSFRLLVTPKTKALAEWLLSVVSFSGMVVPAMHTLSSADDLSALTLNPDAWAAPIVSNATKAALAVDDTCVWVPDGAVVTEKERAWLRTRKQDAPLASPKQFFNRLIRCRYLFVPRSCPRAFALASRMFRCAPAPGSGLSGVPGTNNPAALIHILKRHCFCSGFAPQRIPAVVHHMWLDDDLLSRRMPPEHAFAGSMWRTSQPGFEVRMWHTADIHAAIAKEPAAVQKAFHEAKTIIQKCDLARWVIIAQHGGVYIDLDFYPTGSLRTLLGKRTLWMTRELNEHNGRTQICNGFFAGTAEHPFVRGYIEEMTKNLAKRPNGPPNSAVMETTGPIALARFFNGSGKALRPPDCLGHPCDVMPFNSGGLLSETCAAYRTLPVAFTRWREGSGWGAIKPVAKPVTKPDTLPATTQRSCNTTAYISIICVVSVGFVAALACAIAYGIKLKKQIAGR